MVRIMKCIEHHSCNVKTNSWTEVVLLDDLAKRSDAGLWRTPLYQHAENLLNVKAILPQKLYFTKRSITDRLWENLERLVQVPTATQLAWLTWFTSPTFSRNATAVYLKQNRSTEGCSKLKRSVDMTSSGKNGLNIRTNASPGLSQIGQDQVSGGVSVLCWLAAPVAIFHGHTYQICKF